MPGITDRLSHLFGDGRRRADQPPSRAPDDGGTGDGAGTGILDAYVHDAPSDEAALKIFEGEWSSTLPHPYEGITGPSPLFEDARIEWMLDVLGGVKGFRVLELGPLEAGHTTMLERAGADAITAVEGNTRAYLKCLIVKEVLGLTHSRFLCGDLQAYLAGGTDHFDLCLASGVLYHMRQPVEVLTDMARVSDRLVIWTHYYDPDVVGSSPEQAARFSAHTTRTVDDLVFTEHRYEYQRALEWKGFCGGSARYANWLERDTILECLRRAGFSSIEVGFDEPRAQNGSAFAVVAQRS
jgi:methyltransferase family protein